MKSLKESLLNRPKNINVTQLAAEEYINTNYTIKGKLTFEDVNGAYIVNCNDDVYVKNKKIEKLTNGFEWGKVKGGFTCSNCKNLESLEGAPEKVGKSFYCSYCDNLKSLEGAPKEIGETFDCANCKNLISLEGGPEYVGWDFYCSECSNLESLKGSPKGVGANFYCRECPNLTSLEGAPKCRKIYCDSRLK